MDKDVLQNVVDKTKQLIEAPTVCKELKEVAQAWLEAVGTDKEESLTKQYVEELKEDIVTIDGLIEFASSDAGKGYFGEAKASEIVEHAKVIKAEGAVYCDCPACALVEEILNFLFV